MQDGAQDDGTVDPTTANSGGTPASIDGDNAIGEVEGNSNRNQRRCRRTGSNPVFLDTGAVQQADPLFGVPGLFTVTITSIYQSDIDQRSVLGWGRVSDLDASLERVEKGKLRYRDGAGFHIDFDRPTPIPGVWNFGDHIRVMEIAAGHDRTFMVREEGVIRYFAKCGPGQWHMTAMENRNGVRFEFERDDTGLLTAIDLPEGLRLEMTNDTDRGLRMQIDLLATDGSGHTVIRYAYDTDDNMVLADCPFGDKHEYGYDDAHRRIWFRKNDQYEAHYTSDADGRCVAEETNGPYNGTRLDPARHRLPVKVTLRGEQSPEDVKKVDAFNALDFFIVSTKMADEIDRFTKRQWPRRRAIDRPYLMVQRRRGPGATVEAQGSARGFAACSYLGQLATRRSKSSDFQHQVQALVRKA